MDSGLSNPMFSVLYHLLLTAEQAAPLMAARSRPAGARRRIPRAGGHPLTAPRPARGTAPTPGEQSWGRRGVGAGISLTPAPRRPDVPAPPLAAPAAAGGQRDCS